MRIRLGILLLCTAAPTLGHALPIILTSRNINSHGMTGDVSCSKPDVQASVQTKLHLCPNIAPFGDLREKA